MYSTKEPGKKSESPRLKSIGLTLRLLVKNPVGAIGFAIMVFYFGTALLLQFAPGLIGITNPNYMPPNFSNPFPTPPSAKYPFGTTYPGINLFDGVFKAIRVDVFSSVTVVGAGAIIGTLVGVTAGYKGKLFDHIIMRITDIFFSLPFLVLAMAVGLSWEGH